MIIAFWFFAGLGVAFLALTCFSIYMMDQDKGGADGKMGAAAMVLLTGVVTIVCALVAVLIRIFA